MADCNVLHLMDCMVVVLQDGLVGPVSRDTYDGKVTKRDKSDAEARAGGIQVPHTHTPHPAILAIHPHAEPTCCPVSTAAVERQWKGSGKALERQWKAVEGQGRGTSTADYPPACVRRPPRARPPSRW